ncbi:MAG: hypothetical protein G01um101425_232 [Candidatus Peregrinibacteria bacterium Gr01-1014_25]|nr:MAG: hypothetical protein G01um101425_232 [Candidatus Peregrinibacteria bacterium Gr01-1014_25]
MSAINALRALTEDYADDDPLRKAVVTIAHIGDTMLHNILVCLLEHSLDQREPDTQGLREFFRLAGLRLSTSRKEGLDQIAHGINGACLVDAAKYAVDELDFEASHSLRSALLAVNVDLDEW